MRWVIARVLPVPAPARMQTGPAGAVTAVRCSGSSPASTEPADPKAANPESPITSSVRTVGNHGTRVRRYAGRRSAMCDPSEGILTDADHVLDVLVRFLPPP